MMKRNDGGYILLYVMVVVLTLCILAASICTSAVRNLKIQEHAVDHMQYVYEAEGVGERFVSELCKYARFEADGTTFKTVEWITDDTPEVATNKKHAEAVEALLTDGYWKGEEAVKSALEVAMTHAMNDELKAHHDTIDILDSSGLKITPEAVVVGGYNEDDDTVETDVAFRVVSGDSKLDAVIRITSYVSRTKIEGVGAVDSAKYQYKIDKIEYAYLSYAVGLAPEGGGTE